MLEYFQIIREYILKDVDIEHKYITSTHIKPCAKEGSHHLQRDWFESLHQGIYSKKRKIHLTPILPPGPDVKPFKRQRTYLNHMEKME